MKPEPSNPINLSKPVNLIKDHQNLPDTPENMLSDTAEISGSDNTIVTSLTKFDQQLERIATTLNLFESQLQNVDRQINELETLTSKRVADAQTAVDAEKKPVDLQKVPENATEIVDAEEGKERFVDKFNRVMAAIQDTKDLFITTVKNIYFLAVPIGMMLTMMYPAETKALLTKVETFKSNVSKAVDTQGSYKDKLNAVHEVVSESFFESEDDNEKRERTARKRRVDAHQNNTAAQANEHKVVPAGTEHAQGNIPNNGRTVIPASGHATTARGH
jgi:chaperonin cofactor prefoldin